MKTALGLTLTIFATMSLFATEYDPGRKFVVTGKYFEAHDGNDAMDLNKLSVEILRKVPQRDSDYDEVPLASGRFEDRRITLSGEIDEPTDVTISIQTDDFTFSTDALLVPGGDEISFAFIDYKTPESDQLLLIGSSISTTSQDEKFTIHGMYEPRGEGTQSAHHWVTVTSDEFANDGSPRQIVFATVLIEDGKYLIEAGVDEPKLALISVYRGTNQGSRLVFGANLVIEPGAEFKFQRNDPENSVLMATSDTGRHAKLLDSWRKSEAYLDAQDAYYAAQKTHFESRDPHEVLKEQREEEIAEEDERQDSLEDAEVPKTSAQEIARLTDEDCEHVVMDEVIPGYQGFDPDAPKPQPRYEYQVLWQRVAEIERESLRDLAWNSEDPFDSLVALEIGRQYWSWGEVPETDIIRLYDKLSTLHDDDVVARRIKPARDQLAGTVDKLANNKRLIPGRKVPEFTLQSLADETVSLKDVLAVKDLILIDFWASWCGPCIASFPTLKELRSDYSDDGFEIVSISIDDAREDWEESSTQHNLPWIDLGEMKGYFGAAAIDFGVSFLPKTYLIDAKGCILQKDITSEELKGFISSRYDQN